MVWTTRTKTHLIEKRWVDDHQIKTKIFPELDWEIVGPIQVIWSILPRCKNRETSV